MSQMGEFYQIEKDDFDWVYAQIIEETSSDMEFQIISSQETICIPKGNQREIEVNASIIEQLGVKEGRLKHVYILPTYHFFGNDFKGCCNPIYGFQVFLKEDYELISSQLNALLSAAKAYYSYPVDLNYDKDEFIRKQLTGVFNVNQLFKRLTQLGIDKIDKTEVLKKAESATSTENSHF